MADLLFTNNASSLLKTSISRTDTTIELATGFGIRFPAPSGSQYFLATLEDDQGNFEVVRCTGRISDLLTVLRGQDNTVAKAFTHSTTRIELRLTAAVMNELVQVSGDTMAGPLDMGGKNLVDAVLTGTRTKFTAGEIAGVPLRGVAGVSSNEIAVPAGGRRATAGGANILVAGDDIVAELDVAGTITLNSATVGVRIPARSWLRMEGASALSYLQFNMDGTDANIVCAQTTDLNISGLAGDVVFGANIDLDLGANQLLQAEFADFAVTAQTVMSATTVNIDYTVGSYATLALNATQIAKINIVNAPASGYAPIRLKIVQDTVGSRTITAWPTNTKWPNGSAPALSKAANSVDFVDLWTDDGGNTWYGAFNTDWK